MTVPGAATGGVRRWLRIEGLAVFATTIVVYTQGGHSWLLFVVLFLVPDLGILAYLAGARFGAMAYNVMHNYAGPLLLVMVLLSTAGSVAIPLIWAAHIGIDRALGYGLKYPEGFAETHLGRIGRGRPER